MKENILREIFFDEHSNWGKFVTKYNSRIREVVKKEVEKYRKCGDIDSGFKLWVCEGCHDVRIVPYRCKSRFCNTCSCGETEEWGRIVAQEAVKTNHRHIVFTIDEDLRVIFEKHRFLLKEFMDEAVRIVKEYFQRSYKVTPGVIAGLHTFGARLNFNPHVHMLVTMGGMKENGEWKEYNFIPFPMLRRQWQTVVLKLIRKRLTSEEKKKVQPLLQKAYKNNKEGFYIYATKQKGSFKFQLQYIGRYMRRPAIALRRIVSYDGSKVTFSYYDKQEKKEKKEILTVEEFIGRLIKHIPDTQFKLIRHYGIYSRRTKAICKKLIIAWQQTVRKLLVIVKKLGRRNLRERRIEESGKDPLICPYCQNYYEYMGEVCPESGMLKVKYAKGVMAKKYLERMISNVTGIKKEEAQKEKLWESPKPKESFSQLYLFGM